MGIAVDDARGKRLGELREEYVEYDSRKEDNNQYEAKMFRCLVQEFNG